MFLVKMLPVLLLLVCLCGCSPQKSLAHRLKGADRIIFAWLKEPAGTGKVITGETVSSVVQAIGTGKKCPSVAASPDFRLEFFKGTEHLVTITNSADVFWIGNTPYCDLTRTLHKLMEKSL